MHKGYVTDMCSIEYVKNTKICTAPLYLAVCNIPINDLSILYHITTYCVGERPSLIYNILILVSRRDTISRNLIVHRDLNVIGADTIVFFSVDTSYIILIIPSLFTVTKTLK